MPTLWTTPSFAIYCLFAALLCFNLMGLWGFSGAVRARTKTAVNEEDIPTVSKGAKLLPDDPPEVARVLRAHANAMANIVPFLVLGLLYVLLGAPPKMAWAVFGGFTAARWMHSFVYLGGKQPWRTIFFGIAGLISLFLLFQVTRASITLLTR